MKLTEECYSGRKADERPVRFWLGGRQYQVETVLDQWYDQESISYIRFAPTTAISPFFDNRHRHRMGPGTWSRFARQDETLRHGKLAVAGDPHLPSIERKIQNADEYACNRQNGCGDVGIDQLVQIMKQKPILIWIDSGLGFEPVLQQTQGARPREQFRKDSPNKRSDMQPAKNRARGC